MLKISAHIFCELHKSDYELHPVKHGKRLSPLWCELNQVPPIHLHSPFLSELILLLGVQNIGEVSQDGAHMYVTHFYVTQRCTQGYFKSAHVQKFHQVIHPIDYSIPAIS